MRGKIEKMENKFVDYISTKIKIKREKIEFIIQALKYGIVGVLNTVVGVGSYMILCNLFHIHKNIANPISYVIGFINSFIFNKLWTFSSKSIKSTLIELPIFLFVFFISFGLQYGVFLILRDVINFRAELIISLFGKSRKIIDYAFLIGMICYTISGFLGNKFITFNYNKILGKILKKKKQVN